MAHFWVDVFVDNFLAHEETVVQPPGQARVPLRLLERAAAYDEWSLALAELIGIGLINAHRKAITFLRARGEIWLPYDHPGPGWAAWSSRSSATPPPTCSRGRGGLPDMTALAAHPLRRQISAVGLPEVPDLLEQIVASEGHRWGWRMSADMLSLPGGSSLRGRRGHHQRRRLIGRTAGAQLLCG